MGAAGACVRFLLPAAAARAPYEWSFRRLEDRLSRGIAGALLWPRNSYLTAAFTPFLSDLDMTLLLPREPERDQIAAIKSELRSARRLFPFLGETNVYVESQAAALREAANSFELSRDPRLSEKLPSSTTDSSIPELRPQAAAFLLRMLEADLDNLVSVPGARRRKWEVHFAEIAKRVPFDPPAWIQVCENPFGALCRAALSLLDFPVSQLFKEAAESLTAYFDSQSVGVPLHERPMNVWVRAALPHRACFEAFALPAISEDWIRLCRAQVAWEVWGLSSQYRLADDHQGIAGHLRRLRANAVASFGKEDLPELVALDSLLGSID